MYGVYAKRKYEIHTVPEVDGIGQVAPVLSAIVRVEGAKDVSFNGFTFTETRATYMEQYEVPSGGDWSVHRSAPSSSIFLAVVAVLFSFFCCCYCCSCALVTIILLCLWYSNSYTIVIITI